MNSTHIRSSHATHHHTTHHWLTMPRVQVYKTDRGYRADIVVISLSAGTGCIAVVRRSRLVFQATLLN